ncbi:MAG: PAS domain S-box protein [Chlorobi bacterium]|nr:PAS domain S-box protein [Chlorobiota bacterium]
MFTNVTKEFAELAGRKAESLIGSTLDTLLHPDDSAFVTADFSWCINTPTPISIRFKNRKNKIRWVHLSAAPVRNPSGAITGFIGKVREILQVEVTDQSLALPDSRFREMVEHTSEFIFELTGQKFTYANPSALHTFGYPWDRLREMTLDDICHPDDRRDIRAVLARQYSDAIPSLYREFRIVCANGECIWLSVSSSLLTAPDLPPRLQIIARNITVQKETEAWLAASEATLRSVLQNTLTPIAFLDKEGRFVYANPALERMFDKSWEEFNQKKLFDFIPDYLHLLMKKQITRILQEKQPVTTEFILTRPGQSDVPVLAKMYLIQGPSDHIAIDFTDITEQKDKEQRQAREIEREEERIMSLEELNRMKDRMLSAVSHEFRTPLSSIIGFASALLEDETIDENLKKKYLGIVLQQGKRLVTLVDEMLELSVMKNHRLNLQVQPVDINELLRGTVEKLQLEQETKDITVKQNYSRTLPPVEGDQSRLQQAFYNILHNSLKYTPEGGVVIITTEADDTGIKISFRDNGIGLTEEEISHMYAPFYRGSRINEGIPGTGLGMTITKEIIEEHNGSISVESAPDVYTSVTIHLPFTLTND